MGKNPNQALKDAQEEYGKATTAQQRAEAAKKGEDARAEGATNQGAEQIWRNESSGVFLNGTGGNREPDGQQLATTAYSELMDYFDRRERQQKQQLDQMKQGQLDTIDLLYQQAQKDAYVARLQAEENLDNNLQHQGLSGGMAESTALGNQVNYKNNLTKLAEQKWDSVNQINLAHDSQAVKLATDNANRKLNQLNSDRDFQYQALQDELAQQQQQQAAAKQEALSNLPMYAQDYAAEIAKINQEMAGGDYRRQWLVPKLTILRNEKIAQQQKAAQIAAEKQQALQAKISSKSKSAATAAKSGKKTGRSTASKSSGTNITPNYEAFLAQLKKPLEGKSYYETFLDLSQQFYLNTTEYSRLKEYAKSLDLQTQEQATDRERADIAASSPYNGSQVDLNTPEKQTWLQQLLKYIGVNS